MSHVVRDAGREGWRASGGGWGGRGRGVAGGAHGGRRAAAKVLKERRSQRERARMGTSLDRAIERSIDRGFIDAIGARTIFMRRPHGWPIPPAAPRTATLYPRVWVIALETVRDARAARRRAAMVRRTCGCGWGRRFVGADGKGPPAAGVCCDPSRFRRESEREIEISRRVDRSRSRGRRPRTFFTRRPVSRFDRAPFQPTDERTAARRRRQRRVLSKAQAPRLESSSEPRTTIDDV